MACLVRPRMDRRYRIGDARSVASQGKERPHMMYTAPLAQANPSKPSLEVNALVECIRACFDCAQACTADADADLSEPQIHEMVRCIRLCLDCADVCLATGKI